MTRWPRMPTDIMCRAGGVNPDRDSDCLDLRFPATQAQISEGVAALGRHLTKLGLPAGKAGDIKIALAEAINNVAEHAYADIPEANVHVVCHLCPRALKVVIADSGTPMPDLRVPAGRMAHLGNIRQNLPEGGFGWFLIRQLTSEIRYERHRGHNRLYLEFDLSDLS